MRHRGRRATSWGWWRPLLSALLVVVVLASGCTFGGSGSDEAADPPDTAAGNDEESPSDDPDASDEPESDNSAFIGQPFRPDSVAIDATSVWVSDAACGAVAQIDKATEEVVGVVIAAASASGVAVAGGSVWVGTRLEGTVVRIDPNQLAVSGTVAVPGSPLGLTARGDELWATDPLLGVVYEIDAASGALLSTVRVGANPHHVAIGDGEVWVTNQSDDTVSVISASGRNQSVREFSVGSLPLHVEFGDGSAWVTDSGDNAVRRVNPRTGETEAVVTVGLWPHALAYANGTVWVGTETGSFWRVDPSSNTSERVDDAEFSTIDTAVDGNDVWIADATGGSAVRFDAAAGEVGSVVDLSEFGDCAEFRDSAGDRPNPRSSDRL